MKNRPITVTVTHQHLGRLDDIRLRLRKDDHIPSRSEVVQRLIDSLTECMAREKLVVR